MSWEIAYDPKGIVPELEHRVVVLAPSNRLKRRPKIKVAKDVFALLGEGAGLDREAFWVLPIDDKDTLIGVYLAHLGGTASTVAESAVILRLLLATQAPKVVFVHNHPSGFNAPSPEDTALTKKMVRALRYFDITLVDHIIVAKEDEYFSFRESRMLS